MEWIQDQFQYTCYHLLQDTISDIKRACLQNVNETFMFVGSHEKHLLSFVNHLSAYITAVSTGQISLKFDTGDLHENLSQKPIFG